MIGSDSFAYGWRMLIFFLFPFLKSYLIHDCFILFAIDLFPFPLVSTTVHLASYVNPTTFINFHWEYNSCWSLHHTDPFWSWLCCLYLFYLSSLVHFWCLEGSNHYQRVVFVLYYSMDSNMIRNFNFNFKGLHFIRW